jgi:hypothetical protein
MSNTLQPVTDAKKLTGAAHPPQTGREGFMKTIILSVTAVMLLTTLAVAKDDKDALPEAPSSVSAAEGFIVEAPAPVVAPKMAETKVIDNKFIAMAIVSTGSTFADSYTTLFARQNFLAGKTGVCNMEVESAYLYGTHPTVGRVYAVASAKSALSVFTAYYLRKHHSKFWSLPLIGNSAISLQGVTQNMRACN